LGRKSTFYSSFRTVNNLQLPQPVLAAALQAAANSIPIHYAHKSETEREAQYTFTRWSAQRDRHGTFKLKPSEARFQLVGNN